MDIDLLHQTKEIHTTKDDKEAALMVQSGPWVIISGAIQGDEVEWLLIRR